MRWGWETTQKRLRDLDARTAASKDHDKFTALVKEFNELLDGKQASQESPKQPV